MDNDAELDDNKRQTERVRLDFPIQARVGAGDHLDLEIVDMSATGMRFEPRTSMS